MRSEIYSSALGKTVAYLFAFIWHLAFPGFFGFMAFQAMIHNWPALAWTLSAICFCISIYSAYILNRIVMNGIDEVYPACPTDKE